MGKKYISPFLKINNMQVPFVDLYAQYLTIKGDIDQAIEDTIKHTRFIGGPVKTAFEEAFAAYVGVAHCVGCGNGTDAIEILLQALGIQPGDEVLVPALSWISTAEAVSAIGARPVFVDIDPDTYTIDPALLQAALTDKTRGIIPVHLYGHPADMPAIMAFAEAHHLKVLEDCAQAHGAEIGGKRIGTWGHAASFSFYPGKNLGAYGDAGGMLTDDPEVARTARMIANHGQLVKHQHHMEGRNSRLDGLQAAILMAKLPHLEAWTEARIQHAAAYDQLLAESGLGLPLIRPGARHVFHLYVVRSQERDALRKRLQAAGIGCSVHYPTPMPLMDAYAAWGHTEADFPATVKACQEILSIPMFPELTVEQLTYVADQLRLQPV